MNSDGQILVSSLRNERSLGRWIFYYIELMKPELTGLSVLTAMCGFALGQGQEWTAGVTWSFAHLSIGTLLVGGGAGALNQYLERRYDAEMRRTERRPLPAGHLRNLEVLLFGIILSFAGIVELTLFTNLLTGLLAVLTITTYLFLYTPLKRLTIFSTMIGGIPGALPPVIGWTAARNEITIESWILFVILFLWQMPHFFALAWMYKKDYARAGYKMLTVLDEDGRRTAFQILFHCSGLLPASLIPFVLGMAGSWYFISAVVLSLLFLACGLLFSFSTIAPDRSTARTNVYARQLFFASLVYLPVLLVLMVVDKA